MSRDDGMNDIDPIRDRISDTAHVALIFEAERIARRAAEISRILYRDALARSRSVTKQVSHEAGTTRGHAMTQERRTALIAAAEQDRRTALARLAENRSDQGAHALYARAGSVLWNLKWRHEPTIGAQNNS